MLVWDNPRTMYNGLVFHSTCKIFLKREVYCLCQCVSNNMLPVLLIELDVAVIKIFQVRVCFFDKESEECL